MFDDKNKMILMLRDLDSKNIYSLRSASFLPETYLFDIHSSKYTSEEKNFISIKDKGEKWIAKNPNGCCGKGILLVDNLTEF